MDGIFRKVYQRMYADDKFLRLSPPRPCGQSLWVYLLTGPPTSIVPGLLVTGEAALAESIGWPIAGFRKAFAELADQQMLKFDWAKRVIWIPNGIIYNPPQSPNVVRSWRSQWDLTPECDLKIEAHQRLWCFLGGIGKGYAEAFLEISDRIAKGLPKALPQDLGESGSRKQEAGSREQEIPQPPFDQKIGESETGWLARSFHVLQIGRKEDIVLVSDTFDEMIRVGYEFGTIKVEVDRAGRDRSERLWKLKDRLEKARKNAANDGKSREQIRQERLARAKL